MAALTGHADLLRVLAALDAQGQGSADAREVTLELLGLERATLERRETPDSGLLRTAGTPATAVAPAEAGSGVPGASAPRREVPFWQPHHLEFHSEKSLNERDLRRRDELASVAEAERAAIAEIAPPEAPLLAPPRRFFPRIQGLVTEDQWSREIDLPALIRRVSAGAPIRRIPRRPRRQWPVLVLLLDRSLHLVPFWRDQLALRDALLGWLGRPGLIVRFIDDRGPEGPVFDVRGRCRGTLRDESLVGAPILALSDLGWYGGPTLRGGWLRVGRALRGAGERICALAPVPRARWTPDLAEIWSALPWERPLAAQVRGTLAERAERLLDLASLARRLEPGLLRALRRLLPPEEADLGTEADVWAHQDLVGTAGGWTYLRPEAVEARRERLARLARSADSQERESTIKLLAAAGALLRRWHWNRERGPELWQMEALSLAELAPCAVEKDELARAAVGIQAIARSVVCTESLARKDAIRRWLDHLADHTPGIFSVASVASAGAGAALQQAWGATHPPEDLPPHPDLAHLRVGAGQSRGAGERVVTVRQVGEALEFGHQGPSEALGSPVASLWVAEPAVVPVGPGVATRRVSIASPVELVARPSSAGPIELRTDRSTLHLAPLTKPSWARAIGRDRFGLWAEFFYEGRGGPGVAYRLRWIPPGRFMMGSPADEPGRDSDEGPQHAVVITRGFWLGETPVTQALWEAVTGDNPSYFKGSPDRPVEEVSWDACQEVLIAALNRGAKEGGEDKPWRLPTEAEWEYACRAGTETATYAGPIEIRGANDAPVLDAIAWYGGNSGVEFDLEQGVDSSGWEDKQHPHRQAGTRRVGLKRPNPWGLYDMLGNVWEWCSDWAYRNYSDRDDSSDVVTDPPGPVTGVLRVLRGGSWFSFARDVRAASRYANHPGGRRRILGLRLARDQVR